MKTKKSSKEQKMIDFVGIGAQRCGTTWIYRCLETHPDICVSRVKEVPFFSTDAHFKKGTSYYRSFFTHCGDGQVRGEFNPHYLFDARVAKRLHDMVPDVKFLLSLRNPIDALFSLYLYERNRGTHTLHTFEEYLEAKPELLQNFMYGQNLKRYLEFFSQEDMLIILYDDIRRAPDEVMKSIYHFLGVDSDHRSEHATEVINASDAYFLYVFAKPLYATIAVLEKFSWGKRCVDWLKGVRLRAWLDRFFQLPRSKRADASSEKKETISNETRTRLYSLYQEDIHVLETLLNKDLSHWK